jgi:hypothetical protein
MTLRYNIFNHKELHLKNFTYCRIEYFAAVITQDWDFEEKVETKKYEEWLIIPLHFSFNGMLWLIFT